MSYLEGLRVGAIGVVTGLAFLNEEIDQVEGTEGDKSNKEVLPVLTQVMETTYRDCKAWEEEGKAYNKGEDAVQTDEAINEASYEANDEGAECKLQYSRRRARPLKSMYLRVTPSLKYSKIAFSCMSLLVVCGLIYRNYNVGKDTDIIYGNKKITPQHSIKRACPHRPHGVRCGHALYRGVSLRAYLACSRESVREGWSQSSGSP